jgi:hypothetical protein
VLNIDEHKDGSATISLDCTDEEINLLAQYAILDILKRSLVKMNKNLEKNK